MASIIGLDSLMRKLNALGANANDCLDGAVMKAGLLVEGDAKDLCTTDTGRLKNSIHTTLGGSADNYSYQDNDGNEFSGAFTNTGEDTHVAVVGTNVEYAAYVECGTGRVGEASPSPPKYNGASYKEDWSGMEAQPFLWPALQQNTENVSKLIASELKKEIRRLGG